MDLEPTRNTRGTDSAGTVAIPAKGSWFRRLLAFVGPGYLVSVGYMDPGNWGTDLAGGSKYGYALLWVILLSNLMAQFLQILCARLGLATGKDLAMACRDYYPKPVSQLLWVLCEVAIIACDLAEVIGSAVALNLLFGIPLMFGVLLTAADVLLLLSFSHLGFRKVEAIILTLVATIFVCFGFEIFLAKPDWMAVGRGLVVPHLPDGAALIIALGILGATVMPHNLYLHSSIVQTRKTGESDGEIAEAIKFNTIDTVVALSLAFFVNAAILVVSAAVFHKGGLKVEELQQGHELLGGVLGGASATVFAVALLASGQSSTITGTLAGQIVMEGFLNLKIKPWIRRVITRGLAIIPTLILVQISGGHNTVQLLLISQVVLSMQLPFAIFPLVAFTSDVSHMGRFVNSFWVKWVGYGIATFISGLNIWLLLQTIPAYLVILGAVGLAGFFGYVRFGYRRKLVQA